MKLFDIFKRKRLEETNHGVIIKPLKDTDYVSGINSPLVPEIILPDGDSFAYLPPGEYQFNRYFDAMDCVSQGAMHNIETLMNFKLWNNQISNANVLWLEHVGYIDTTVDPRGMFNGSVRALAKLSGTTEHGNSFTDVADRAKHGGIIPEAIWPSDMNLFKTWNEFYAEVPTSITDVGLEFSKRFKLNYEYLNQTQLGTHLQHGPIQLLINTCKQNWSVEPVQWCGLSGVGHEVLLYSHKDGEYQIRDNYNPFNKELVGDYVIPYAMQYMITEIVSENNTMLKIVGNRMDQRQYLLGVDGKLRHIFNPTILEDLHAAGVVDKNVVEWRDHLEGLEIVRSWAVIA